MICNIISNDLNILLSYLNFILLVFEELDVFRENQLNHHRATKIRTKEIHFHCWLFNNEYPQSKQSTAVSMLRHRVFSL